MSEIDHQSPIHQAIDACLKSKAGIIGSYKPEWDMYVYWLDGKIVAELGTYSDHRPLLSVKLEPAFSELLRAQYPDKIIPGYYCNKTHWSSAFLDAGLDEALLISLVDASYASVFAKLPKKRRAELEADAQSVPASNR